MLLLRECILKFQNSADPTEGIFTFDCVCSLHFLGCAFMSEPQVGPKEQSSLHSRPPSRHLPASANPPVLLRGEDGDSGRERILPGVYGKPDEEDKTNHQPLQGRKRKNV